MQYGQQMMMGQTRPVYYYAPVSQIYMPFLINCCTFEHLYVRLQQSSLSHVLIMSQHVLQEMQQYRGGRNY
jgi:hypothetical protein